MTEVQGVPQAVRLDNGPELTTSAFVAWDKEHDVQLMFIQPGKPSLDAFVERFNRSFRDPRGGPGCLAVQRGQRSPAV